MNDLLDHAWRRPITCFRCGGVAATALIDPHSGGRGLTLTLEGFVVRKSMLLSEPRANDIADAEDADVTHLLPPSFQGFSCVECDAAYCAACWTVDAPQFEGSEYSGTEGTCPAGHRGIVDE